MNRWLTGQAVIRRTLQARSFSTFCYDPEQFFSQRDHTDLGFVVPEEHPVILADLDEEIERPNEVRPLAAKIRERIAARQARPAAASLRPLLGAASGH